MDIKAFWSAVLAQDADKIREFFTTEACVNWHNTNEHFTLEDFIRANCEYPGDWCGEVEKTVYHGDMLITVTNVHSADSALSFHVVSFIQLRAGKIISIDEYWGDDGAAPQWRRDMGIGTAIK